jgi:phospholipid-translocating ATPase
MCHAKFNWDPGTWKYDYVGHFEKFKEAITKAATLYFPDYSLPWVVRSDASEVAVGAVLFQERTLPDGTVRHEPIAFASKKLSDPATRWDTFKREAYGIYYAVKSFGWYLLGKEFVVETDHRNLVWIETSDSPHSMEGTIARI